MAKLSTQMVTTALLAIILTVVLFQAYAEIVPIAQDGGDELGDAARCDADGGYWNLTLSDCRNNESSQSVSTQYDYTSVPLSGIFSGNGIVFLIIMAALVFVVIKNFTRDMK